MPGTRAVREFDEIAPVYDETREPLDAPTFDGLVHGLTEERVEQLLEVGVGTGRVAAPLGRRGVTVTGIDASREMLARARAKRIPRLVRGSAYRLPFRNRAFDGTLFVHVLHVLDDPASALREAARVSRRTVLALVSDRDRPAGGPDGGTQRQIREIMNEVLKEAGLAPPTRGRPWERERELLQRVPPNRSTRLSEREVTETLDERLARMGRRGNRWMLRAPPEVVERAIARVRERLGNPTFTYQRRYVLAAWDSDGLRGAGTPVALEQGT